MTKEFILDLKVARRKAGLTQADYSHLLGRSRSVAGQLETGKRLPNLKEICALSLIYGRTFESLFSAVFAQARHELAENLASLPDVQSTQASTFNRSSSLDALAERLTVESTMGYGG